MQLNPGNILHVYNRGNNKQLIFFNEDNYYFFTDKVKKQIATVSDVLAYCLMPNHFHFLLHTTEYSCQPKKVGSLTTTELQNGIRLLQSSYANSINKQYTRTGSLFQQNTKLKVLNDKQYNYSYRDKYAETCFHYIHQNPLKAGLVSKLEDWKFSSFNEYMLADKGFCNIDIAKQLLDIKQENFYKVSYDMIKPEFLEKIW